MSPPIDSSRVLGRAVAETVTEESVRRKAARRILPFLFVLYVVAYLDRANIAFARIPMSLELQLSDAVYGFGAGIFFVGYFLLEIPGALIVERFGARRWIGRILISWGLITVLFSLVRTPAQFYLGRFLLGAAEAGFFPGVIVYLSHWFLKDYRSRALSYFVIAAPAALALGGPLSALMLRISWFGLSGWRWMFILQGLPAVVLGFVAFKYLIDYPRQAQWLDVAEKQCIEHAFDRENRQLGPRPKWWCGLLNKNVLLLCAANGFANVAGYGFIFWLPSTIKTITGLTAGMANLVSALPYVCAMLLLWLAGHSSDKTGKYKLHAALPMLFAALCYLSSIIPGQSPAVVLCWLCLTGGSIFAWIPGFWTMPTAILTGPARAASIGLINSVGNLGGFLGPAIIGSLRTGAADSSHTLIYVVVIAYCVAALLIICVSTRQTRSANSQELITY